MNLILLIMVTVLRYRDTKPQTGAIRGHAGAGGDKHTLDSLSRDKLKMLTSLLHMLLVRFKEAMPVTPLKTRPPPNEELCKL